MPRRITLRLTTESISNAISEMKDFKKDAMDAMNKLCEEFTNEGKQLVYKNVSQLQFTTESTGRLASSVEGFFAETTGKGLITVFADNGEGVNYAQIVEFGSGVVMANGEASPPPDRPADWEYDINRHRYKTGGWWYKEGKWTRGQAPRPFMWQSYQELLEQAQGKVKSIKYYNVPNWYSSHNSKEDNDKTLESIGFID